jgi:hypothetical protein
MACVYAQWHVFLSREPPKARMRLTSSHAHGILIPHVLSGWRRTGRPPRPGLSARPSSPSCSGSSPPILKKGEQFARVMCILTLFCSHYKFGLY